MPTWDEITPDLQRSTRTFRMTCTNALIVANVVGFLFSGIVPRFFGVPIMETFAFDAHRAIDGLWLWQFLTYTFVQAVDLWFMIWFVFHAYILYLFGNELERELGPRRFLSLYFAYGFYGAVAHAVYQYVSGSAMGAISLFGPVFGVIMAYALRNPRRPILFFFVIPMKLLTAVLVSGAILVFYFVVSFHEGLSPASILGAGIAAWAIHALSPRLNRWADRRRAGAEQDRVLDEIELRRNVDQILEKISHEGMGSLTRTERRILKRASDPDGKPGGR